MCYILNNVQKIRCNKKLFKLTKNLKNTKIKASPKEIIPKGCFYKLQISYRVTLFHLQSNQEKQNSIENGKIRKNTIYVHLLQLES